jgi:hypothetical protein
VSFLPPTRVLPAGCYCDQFCRTAGDCCEGCGAACGAGNCRETDREAPPAGPGLDPGVKPVDSTPERPHGDGASALFTQRPSLLEAEQACANAIQPLLPLSTTINIPVVYVSARVNGVGGTFDQAYANRLIANLNAAYARAGFTFTIQTNYAADFADLAAVDTPYAVCNNDAGNPPPNCRRCAVYNQAAQNLRNPRTLFIFGVPAASELREHLPPPPAVHEHRRAGLCCTRTRQTGRAWAEHQCVARVGAGWLACLLIAEWLCAPVRVRLALTSAETTAVCFACVAVACAGTRPDPVTGLLSLGAAMPPQWVVDIPAGPGGILYAPCADGFWGLEPGTLQNGGTVSERLAITTAVHEVRAVEGLCGPLTPDAQSQHMVLTFTFYWGASQPGACRQ